MAKCPLCSSSDSVSLFHVDRTPVFQNKVYATPEEALDAVSSTIDLCMCMYCGMVYNVDFSPELMNYDKHYQNEQNYSPLFRTYLGDLAQLLEDKGFKNKKAVEIGCGKGYFLELLAGRGFDITGFDPAYEGENKNITKERFTESNVFVTADLIIMRHTLEHIPQPFDFLSHVCNANGFTGHIFIEVPSFEWIIENSAFWDIHYEHCNYFTQQTLSKLFSLYEYDRLFGGQYCYILAPLASLQQPVSNRPVSSYEPLFLENIEAYSDFVQKNRPLVWGAGAKGASFLNIIDPNQQFVEAVIDINPKKQGRFLGRTAHPIVGPGSLSSEQKKRLMLVMNGNYRAEIESQMNHEITTVTLGEIHEWNR